MLDNLGGIHLVIILAIVVLVFGSTKLPALSKGIAQSIKIFRTESRADVPAAPAAPATTTTMTPAAPAASAPTTAAPAPAPVVLTKAAAEPTSVKE